MAEYQVPAVNGRNAMKAVGSVLAECSHLREQYQPASALTAWMIQHSHFHLRKTLKAMRGSAYSLGIDFNIKKE
jgi:hypothetical protein